MNSLWNSAQQVARLCKVLLDCVTVQMTFWCTVHSKTLVLSISSAAPAIKYGKTPLKSVDSTRDGRCEVVRERERGNGSNSVCSVKGVEEKYWKINSVFPCKCVYESLITASGLAYIPALVGAMSTITRCPVSYLLCVMWLEYIPKWWTGHVHYSSEQ